MIKLPMWTMEDAIRIVGDLQPRIKPYNYHVLLGGGVLNKGESYNDLDLYFLPFSNVDTSNLGAVEVVLEGLFGRQYPIGLRETSTEYESDDETMFVQGRHTYLPGNGKRIDVFIA